MIFNHQGRYIGGRGIGCCEQNILSPLFYFTSNPTSFPSKSVSRVLLPGDKKLFLDHNLVDFKFSVNDNLANLFKLDRRWLILLLLFCLTDGSSRSASCSTVLHWRKEEKNKISNRTTAACSCQGMYLYHHVW